MIYVIFQSRPGVANQSVGYNASQYTQINKIPADIPMDRILED